MKTYNPSISNDIKDFSLPSKYKLWRKFTQKNELLSNTISLDFFICDLLSNGSIKLVRFRHPLGRVGCRVIDNKKIETTVQGYLNESIFSIYFRSLTFRIRGYYDSI
jgi:hypothetical protein